MSDKSFLQNQVDSLEQRVEELNVTINQKDEELDRLEESRKELKLDVEDMNNKMT